MRHPLLSEKRRYAPDTILEFVVDVVIANERLLDMDRRCPMASFKPDGISFRLLVLFKLIIRVFGTPVVFVVEGGGFSREEGVMSFSGFGWTDEASPSAIILVGWGFNVTKIVGSTHNLLIVEMVENPLNPTLVLCRPCREKTNNINRLSGYMKKNEEDREFSGAVLVRDICSAKDCPALPVRNHLCVEHILEYELAFQNCIPLRVCHGCRQNVIKLHFANLDVWYVLTDSIVARKSRGVSWRFLDRDEPAIATISLYESLVRTKKRISMCKRFRRSARTLRKLHDYELQKALDWSVGNITVKKLFLWKENKHRIHFEQATRSENNPIVRPKVVLYRDPDTIFCVIKGCRRFAKTGNRCRFHTMDDLSNYYAIAPLLA